MRCRLFALIYNILSKLCAECAGIEEDGSSEAVFNNLIFVIRDWDDETGEQKGEVKKMVSELKDLRIIVSKLKHGHG